MNIVSDFEHLNLGFVRPVKYRISYIRFGFDTSSGKVRPSISNRIT